MSANDDDAAEALSVSEERASGTPDPSTHKPNGKVRVQRSVLTLPKTRGNNTSWRGNPMYLYKDWKTREREADGKLKARIALSVGLTWGECARACEPRGMTITSHPRGLAVLLPSNRYAGSSGNLSRHDCCKQAATVAMTGEIDRHIQHSCLRGSMARWMVPPTRHSAAQSLPV
jgi:hypothetical protein